MMGCASQKLVRNRNTEELLSAKASRESHVAVFSTGTYVKAPPEPIIQAGRASKAPGILSSRALLMSLSFLGINSNLTRAMRAEVHPDNHRLESPVSI